MLGLSAYFDESGQSEDPVCRFVGMAGLCAPSAAWEEFDRKWQAALDEYCEGRPFHMKAFANQAPPFDGWSKDKRERFFGALVQAIKETRAHPFGSVVSLDAYEFISRGIPVARKLILDPYYLCFQDVTRAAAVNLIGYSLDHSEDWEEFQKNERVAMVYARQDRFGAISSPDGSARQNMGRAESLWYAIKDSNPHYGKWMGSYASAPADDLNFLQAADLFAYELTHEFENRVRRPKDPMRWALSEILPGTWQDFLHTYYGVPQLLELLTNSGALGPHEDHRHALSISSSMDSIAHRNLLFERKDVRKGKSDRKRKVQ